MNNLTAEEVELLRYIIRSVHQGGNPFAATKHPAWMGLTKKFGFTFTTRRWPSNPDRRPPETLTGTEALRVRFLDQGFDEKEVAVILKRLNK